ncbi:MAG TPA: hypothetical protein VFB21_16045 [Chthonomonadaceae bacterium]|nr:hypothetical protein [Chthonomonadaceae bacterium]
MRIAAIISPRVGGWARLREAQAATSPSEAVAHWLAPEGPESLWRRIGSIAADALALVGNRFHMAPGVRHFRTRRLALDAAGPLPIELDGDAAGTTPATITVAPNASRILIPAGRFSQD